MLPLSSKIHGVLGVSASLAFLHQTGKILERSWRCVFSSNSVGSHCTHDNMKVFIYVHLVMHNEVGCFCFCLFVFAIRYHFKIWFGLVSSNYKAMGSCILLVNDVNKCFYILLKLLLKYYITVK